MTRGRPGAWVAALLLVVPAACADKRDGAPATAEPHEGSAPPQSPDGSTTPPQPPPVDSPQDGGTIDAGSQTSICRPVADGPFWLSEGETVEFDIRCDTGWSHAAMAFEVDALPEGATLDATTGRVSWTPGYDQAAVYQLTLRETHTGEAGVVKIAIADSFYSSKNVPLKDASAYTEEYGVPVMHLSSAEKLRSSVYTPAQLVYRGHTYSIQAKYRGATSLDFPKRSFTLEFTDADEFQDPQVGFGRRDKLVLVTTFNDNSYVRSRLGFEIWRRMDPQNNIQVKTFPVVVFLNGKYFGLYTAADKINSDLIRRQGLRKEGNLYKAFHADANFSLYMTTGEEKWSLAQGYEKKHGTPEAGQPGATDDIADLTEFVATSTDAELRGGLDDRVHVRDYENWWIFVTLILGTDSGGKNAYHYHDPQGGPFRYIPWDLDASFGQDWDTRRTSAEWRADFADRNELFRRMLADPALIGPLRTRYGQLLKGELSKDKVLALYDELQAQIAPVARRDERRWGAEYRSFYRWSDRHDLRSYDDEAAYVRQWIAERWDTFLQTGVP